MGKRKRSAPRYKGIKLSSSSVAPEENPEALRVEFPKELIDAFVSVCLSGWEEKLYKKYVNLATDFLGKTKYQDKLISGALIVRLSRACQDLTSAHKKAAKLKMECSEHPKYKAIRSPRSECDRCRDIYNGKKTKKKTKAEVTNEARASTQLVDC